MVIGIGSCFSFVDVGPSLSWGSPARETSPVRLRQAMACAINCRRLRAPASVFSPRARRARGLNRPHQPSRRLVPMGTAGPRCHRPSATCRPASRMQQRTCVDANFPLQVTVHAVPLPEPRADGLHAARRRPGFALDLQWRRAGPFGARSTPVPLTTLPYEH